MRLSINLRHAVELVMLPGLAVVLPWPWCFRLFRRVCAWGGLYRERTDAAWQAAASWQNLGDAAAWKAAYRLVHLVDHADLFLSRTRSDRWMRRYLQVQGQWPARGPFLGVTYHWGAGLWALRHLRAQGLQSALLVYRPTRDEMGDYLVAYWYGEMRLAETGRASGSPVIDSARAVWEIRRAWRRGVSVIVGYDVPRGIPRTGRRRQAHLVLGREMDFPIGLPKLAADSGVPVLSFDCRIDRGTGRRTLRIHPVVEESSEHELSARLAEPFDALLREDLGLAPQRQHRQFPGRTGALSSREAARSPRGGLYARAPGRRRCGASAAGAGSPRGWSRRSTSPPLRPRAATGTPGARRARAAPGLRLAAPRARTRAPCCAWCRAESGAHQCA